MSDETDPLEWWTEYYQQDGSHPAKTTDGVPYSLLHCRPVTLADIPWMIESEASVIEQRRRDLQTLRELTAKHRRDEK